MRKRICILGLIGAITITGMGCGEGNSDNRNSTADSRIVTASVKETDAGTEQGAAAIEQEEQTAADTEQSEQEITEAGQEEQEATGSSHADTGKVYTDREDASDALRFVEDMKIGWNLGNTFDAYTDVNKADEMAYETEWCKVATTREMIDEIKAAGFETIRIPVSWHNHVSDDGNYTISDAWLNRVQEVVDYAMDNEMYVIINIHHDNSTGYMYPLQQYMEQSKAYVSSIWSQVAARFADYDEHLIMEGLNEPRLVGTGSEWWLDLNNRECVEAVQCINELNQLFVDTVRSSGGKNTNRFLLVPGYAASLQGVSNTYFELPKDVDGNENKILVEIHGYTPYNFALKAAGESGSTDQWSADSAAATADIDNMMDTLYELYVKNGIGVVIDEFGARDKGGNVQARAEFASYYVAAARARGITCCWWDNNSFTGGGENFGIFHRASCRFEYPQIVEGMMEAFQ